MTDKSKNILGKYFLGKQFLDEVKLFDPLISEIENEICLITHDNVFEWMALNIYEDLISIVESFINNELKNKYELLDPEKDLSYNESMLNLVQFDVLKKCISNPNYQLQSIFHQVKLRLTPFRIPSWSKLIEIIEKKLNNDVQTLKANFDIYLHQKQNEIIIFDEMITYDHVENMARNFREAFSEQAYNIMKYAQALQLIHDFWKDEFRQAISPHLFSIYQMVPGKLEKILSYFVTDIRKSLIIQALKFRAKNQHYSVVQSKLINFFRNEKYKNLIFTVVYQSIKNIYSLGRNPSHNGELSSS